MSIQKISVQIRRDTKTNWEAANTVLLDGQLAMETDGSNKNFKVGDGTTPWSDLPYILKTTGTNTSAPIFIYHKFLADSASFQDDSLKDRTVSELDISYDKVNLTADGNNPDLTYSASTGTITRTSGNFRTNLILKVRIWPS